MRKRGTPLPINGAMNRSRTKLGLELGTWMVIVFVSIAVFLVGSRPNPSTTTQPAKATNDPALKDCEAISDPAQADDCRLWKGVAQAKKKSHADNVVKHSPGSIQQP